MLLTQERLSINLILIFGSGGSRRKPRIFGAYFQPADNGPVPGGIGQFRGDLLPREGGGGDLFRGQRL